MGEWEGGVGIGGVGGSGGRRRGKEEDEKESEERERGACEGVPRDGLGFIVYILGLVFTTGLWFEPALF